MFLEDTVPNQLLLYDYACNLNSVTTIRADQDDVIYEYETCFSLKKIQTNELNLVAAYRTPWLIFVDIQVISSSLTFSFFLSFLPSFFLGLITTAIDAMPFSEENNSGSQSETLTIGGLSRDKWSVEALVKDITEQNKDKGQ